MVFYRFIVVTLFYDFALLIKVDELSETLRILEFHWKQLLIVTAFYCNVYSRKNRDGLLYVASCFSARDIDFRKLLGTRF